MIKKKARAKKKVTKSWSNAEIIENFPEEWDNLRQLAHSTTKPGIPRDVKIKLKKEIDSLVRGTVFDLPASKEYPFILTCGLMWEEGDYPALRGIENMTPRKGATAREKSLIKLLWDVDPGAVVLWDVFEEAVNKSAFFKSYSKRIKVACKAGAALEKKYNFDFDEMIQKSYYR